MRQRLVLSFHLVYAISQCMTEARKWGSIYYIILNELPVSIKAIPHGESAVTKASVVARSSTRGPGFLEASLAAGA